MNHPAALAAIPCGIVVCALLFVVCAFFVVVENVRHGRKRADISRRDENDCQTDKRDRSPV